jgi:hypothetical protein
MKKKIEPSFQLNKCNEMKTKAKPTWTFKPGILFKTDNS